MPIFALRNIEALSPSAQAVFKQLEIKERESDEKGKLQLDEFEKLLESTTFKPELKSFLSYIEHWSQNIRSNAPKKFKIISNKKSIVTEYEFKPENTRIYMALINGVRIVFYGNIKRPSTQDNDIQHFRNLINQYLQQVR